MVARLTPPATSGWDYCPTGMNPVVASGRKNILVAAKFSAGQIPFPPHPLFRLSVSSGTILFPLVAD